MKYKNKFLFICLIIFLFSVASVCASDIGKTSDDQSDDLEIENQTIAADDNVKLSAVDENSDDNLAQIDEDPALGGKNSEITIDAGSIYVGESAKINITVQNATGYVVVSVANQTFNETLSEHQVKLDVAGLACGSHNVAVFYSGDDDYLAGFKLDTIYVSKHQTEITDIRIDGVSYGEDANIEVNVPNGVEGDIIIRLNDALQTNITERISDGKAVFKVQNLAVGNYTVNAIYLGNEYYNVSNVKSASFKVKKANPGLDLVSFGGTVFDNATIQISLNDEIHDEYVNITVGEKHFSNVPIEYGQIEFKTQILEEIKNYKIVIEYGGNEKFNSSRIERNCTPSKITTYGITITPMNITINDVEIIEVEVPDHVDDVVVWVDGNTYRNTSFTNNKAIFKILGLKEGVHIVTTTVNDTEFDHRNFTSLFTVSKVDPSINIIVINETPIHVGDRVKIIVAVPADASENVSIMFDGKQFSQKPVSGNATFEIDALTSGDRAIVAIYNGDDKYRTNATTEYMTVYKLQPFFNVLVQDISINDTEDIMFSLPYDASGNITVFVDDKKCDVAVSGGKGILSISKFHKGEYNVNATYNGDGKYLSAENDTEMFRVIINSDQMDIIDERNNTVSVYLNDSANGNVTIEINGQTFQGSVNNGVSRIVLTNATMGTHHAHVVFVDSVTLETLESFVDVNVPKYAAPLDVISSVIIVGDIAYINVTAPKSATGNISIEVEGKSYTEAIEDGIAKFEITLLSAGNTTLSVKYDGDGSYVENSTSAKLTVLKQQSTISVDVKDIDVGETALINITGPNDISGTVIVNVNGINYTAVISDGIGSVSVDNLQNGTYEIFAEYMENAKYLSSTGTQNVSVSKIETTLSSSDVVAEYNDGKYLVATLKDVYGRAVSGVQVSVDLDGVKYLITDANGQVNLSLMNIPANVYNVVVNFAGDAKYVNYTTDVNVTVKKIETTLSSSDVVAEYNDGKYLVATLKDVHGRAVSGANVSVDLDGVKYLVSDANGQVNLSLMNIAAGIYNVAVNFSGDEKYVNSTADVNVTVKKIETTLSSSDVVAVYNDGKYLVATLKDVHGSVVSGAKVSVDIDGVKYLVTDSKGQVKLSLANIAPGSYNVAVNFAGDAKYVKSTAAVKVTVNKANPKLSAAKKTFKRKAKTKKYTVMLKTNTNKALSGVNVVLKIKNKKYTAKTDASGKATFNIKKLTKKGKYASTVTFNGNEYYNKVSKTVKITVK